MSDSLVYISLVNWNGAERTIRCIESLRQQTYTNYRILVVDNASADDSAARIQAAYPEILLLYSDENRGYAGGHYLSVKQALAAGAELLWILNNDTVLQFDALELLVNAYHTHGEGVYGGVPLETEDNTSPRVLMHHKFLNPDYREVLFDMASFAPYGSLFPDPTQAQRIAAASGSCLMITLSVVDNHGFMDTDYFLYSEEIDYCFRLRRHDVPIWIVPNALIWHEGEGSTRSVSILSDIVQYYRIRNQLVRIKRFGSKGDLIRCLIKDEIMVIWYLLHGRFRTVRFVLEAMWHGLRGQLGKTYPPEHYV